MKIIDGVLKEISASDIKCGKVRIPFGVTKIDKKVFINNEEINEVILPDSLIEIGSSAFENCTMIKKIVFPNNLKKIGSSAFKSCLSLEKIYLNSELNEIGDEAFKSCLFLNNVTIPSSICKLGKDSFSSLNYSYLINNKIIFSNDEIKTKKNEIMLPVGFIELISNKENIYDFYKNSDFISFNSNCPNIIDLWKENAKYELFDNDLVIKELNINKLIDGEKEYDNKYYSYKDEAINLYKFAYLLGCFNKEKYKNSECRISQKSSSLFSRLLKSDSLCFKNYYKYFNNLPIDKSFSEDAISFISHQDKNEFDNINLLIELENKYKGIFAKTLYSFNDIKKLRNNIDYNGKNYTVPWRNSIINYYHKDSFCNTSEDVKDIANLFSTFGLNQKVFDEAVRIRKIYKKNKIKKHILNKKLKEETLAESIYKARKDSSIVSIKDFADILYEKQFTYEWLDKSKPENFILGLYCSCCANITGNSYGNEIAKYSILSDDVQNLVVRDINNQIIGKATIYVNRKEGYAVINDFEINKKYRYGESETNPGIYKYEYYDDKKTDKQEKYSEYRHLIFNAFKRGIDDFVREYNKINNIKLTKVNVGMGANRLKKYVLEYKPELNENKLYVPDAYKFNDATLNHQYTLVKVV